MKNYQPDHPCKGMVFDHGMMPIGELSPVFSAWLHEREQSSLSRTCESLNLSIHDRHLVQAALDRGDDMQQFAQGIIRRGC